MSRQPPRRRVIIWQWQTVMATGETLDLRNYVVATSNIGSRMLMESRSTDRDNFGASNQPGRPYRRHSNQTFDSCKMGGVQAILPVSFVS
jgi:ATP-dependent Clp protease ATP-binding subunit ClpA